MASKTEDPVDVPWHHKATVVHRRDQLAGAVVVDVHMLVLAGGQQLAAVASVVDDIDIGATIAVGRDLRRLNGPVGVDVEVLDEAVRARCGEDGAGCIHISVLFVGWLPSEAGQWINAIVIR